jgi:hypothetical protein
MADHHRQPSSASTASSNSAPAMTGSAAQFSAMQQYQVKIYFKQSPIS